VLEGLFLLHEHNNFGDQSTKVEHEEPPVVKMQKHVVIKAYYSLGHCSIKEKNHGPWIRCL